MAPRRATTKGPTDLTGREDERLKTVNAEEIEQRAQEMAMTQSGATRPRKRTRNVVDYTDAARPKPEARPVRKELPKGPVVIRPIADIENMTFGKEIIDAGDFTDPTNPRMPVLGSLKRYDFKQGQSYKVDWPLYEHLVQIGYVEPIEDDDDYED